MSNRYPIEEEFPTGPLSQLANREAKARRHYRPVYTMHRYWARRPGSIFRGILQQIFAQGERALWDQMAAEHDHESGFAEQVDNVWRQYVTDPDFGSKTVLDPFMGGGTTLIEARRFDCNVIGSDLNPVAWFIVKKALEDGDIAQLDEAFAALEDRIASELQQYYRTPCPSCETTADGTAYLWVRQYSCPDCRTTIPLFNQHYFAEARRKEDERRHIVCPACWALGTAPEDADTTICEECSGTIKITDGPVSNGTVCCPMCDGRYQLSAHATDGPMPTRLYGIEYYCAVCDERGYREPTDHDMGLYRKAAEQCDEVWDELPIPTQRRHRGSSDRAYAYGYTHFHQLFNDRQLLLLGRLLQAIMDVDDQQLRECLLLAFSATLETNNMFCTYNRSANKIEPIYNYHTITVQHTPVENNVWGSKYGRGTFRKMYQKLRAGKVWCQSPTERFIDQAGNVGKVATRRTAQATLVDDASELGDTGDALLYCGNSETLPIPDNSADAIVTDPPYYDNRLYADASDFFYVWLREALRDTYECFEPPRIPKAQEAVVDPSRSVETYRSEAHYVELLESIFTEAVAKLKDDGVFVFTFHHAETDAWLTILRAVLNAGLKVTAIHPVQSETRGGTRVSNSSGDYDSIIVCRPCEEEDEELTIGEFQRRVRERAIADVQSVWENNESVSVDELRQMTLARCVELYSRSQTNNATTNN